MAGFYDSLRTTTTLGVKNKTKASMMWFYKEISKSRNYFKKGAIRRIKGQLPPIGSLVHFIYDAKYKDTLPYWDAFPLVIPIDWYDDGFLGLNLHYLPYTVRAKLLDALNQMRSVAVGDQHYLRISYTALKQIAKDRVIKHCIKRYLSDHIKSDLIAIKKESWEKVVFLQTQQFQKETSKRVWADL